MDVKTAWSFPETAETQWPAFVTHLQAVSDATSDAALTRHPMARFARAVSHVAEHARALATSVERHGERVLQVAKRRGIKRWQLC